MQEKTLTVRVPDRPNFGKFREHKDRYSGPKFFVALIGLAAMYVAGYNGLVTLPSLSAMGGALTVVLALVFVAFLTYALNSPSMKMRWAALVLAVLAAILITANWSSLGEAFGNLDTLDFFWLVLGLAALVVVSLWLSKKTAPRRQTVQPQSRREARGENTDRPAAETTTSTTTH